MYARIVSLVSFPSPYSSPTGSNAPGSSVRLRVSTSAFSLLLPDTSLSAGGALEIPIFAPNHARLLKTRTGREGRQENRKSCSTEFQKCLHVTAAIHQ